MNRKLMLAIFSLFFFTLTISNAQVIEEGFEAECENDDNSFFNGCIENWTSSHGTADTRSNFNGVDPFEGEKYAHMFVRKTICSQDPAEDDRGEGIVLNYDFENGGNYTFSFAIRTDQFQTENIRWVLTADLPNNTSTGNCSPGSFVPPVQAEDVTVWNVNDFSSTAWQVVELTFDVPNTGNYNQLWFRASNLQAQGDEKTTDVFLDDIFLEGCINRTYFPKPEFCRVGDLLEISFSGLEGNVNNGWYIFLKDEGEPCDNTDRTNATQIYFENSGTNASPTITIPEPYNYDFLTGRCLVLLHGTWSNNIECWKQFDRTLLVPEVPRLEPLFNIEMQPYSENFVRVDYTAVDNVLEVSHNWTIECADEYLGEETIWENWNVHTSLTEPEVTSLQRRRKYYRVCHEVSSIEEDICSRSSLCVIIYPQDEEGFLVTDEAGQEIDYERIDESGESTDAENGGRRESKLANLVSKGKLIIAPNPAKTFFNLNNQYDQDILIELLTVEGQLLSIHQVNSNDQKTIGTTDLSSGLYLIKAINKNSGAIIKTEKLIINK